LNNARLEKILPDGNLNRRRGAMNKSRRINFAVVARIALQNAETVVMQWLPNGTRQSAEWVVCNPKRDDRRPGSFKINLLTGAWADFAIGVSGGDLISLAAYLADLNHAEAALRLADMLRIDPYEQ